LTDAWTPSETCRRRLLLVAADVQSRGGLNGRAGVVMADQNDVRRIALALPETSEGEGRFSFSVRNKDKQKQFAWAWNERVEPKKPRIPRSDALAVRVADRFAKEILLASDEEKFFTEPHYEGFPAVLIRLPAIEVDELEELIIDAWCCQAPRALVEAFQSHTG
jgi:hypothetical protein